MKKLILPLALVLPAAAFAAEIHGPLKSNAAGRP
jgi:hypothetical protein